MSKYKKKMEYNLVPLSEQDVAQVSLTEIETQSSNCPLNEENTLFILLAILHSLSRNVLSKDVWILAFGEVEAACNAYGMDKEKVKIVIDQMKKTVQSRRGENPLSILF